MWFLVALLAVQSRPVTQEIGDWIHQVWDNPRANTFHQYLMNSRACPSAAIGLKQEGTAFVLLLRFPSKSFERWLEFPKDSPGSFQVGEADPERMTWRRAPDYTLETDISVWRIQALGEARELKILIRSRSGTEEEFRFRFGPETRQAFEAFLKRSVRAP